MTQQQVAITTYYDIHAAHKLYREDWTLEKNKSVFGQCSQLHGHQYRLDVTIMGPVDPETGMVLNLRDFESIVMENVVGQWDHQYLNELPFFKDRPTTAEWMVLHAFEVIQAKLPPGCRLTNVKVWETSEFYAEFQG